MGKFMMLIITTLFLCMNLFSQTYTWRYSTNINGRYYSSSGTYTLTNNSQSSITEEIYFIPALGMITTGIMAIKWSNYENFDGTTSVNEPLSALGITAIVAGTIISVATVKIIIDRNKKKKHTLY